MFRIITNCLLLLAIVLVFASCGENTTPLNVIFKDGTLYGSPKYSISAIYLEDKELHSYRSDILIMSTLNNHTLKINKELSNSFEITIPNQNVWYSFTELAKVAGQDFKYNTFKKAQSTTFIINSVEKANLSFKAVAGVLEYNLNTNIEKLTNIFDVSQTFEIKIEKVVKKT